MVSIPKKLLKYQDCSKKVLEIAFELARFMFYRIVDGRTTQMASSLTYTSLLSVVPFFTVVLAIFTAFPQFLEIQERLNEQFIAGFLPEDVSIEIKNYINQFVTNASEIKTVSGLVLVVMAVSLVYTVDSALNEIWKAPSVRSWSQRVLVYWAILTLGPIFLGSSLWLANQIGHESSSWLNDLHYSILWLLSWIPLLLTTVTFACIFVFVPNCYVQWRDAVVGGLFVALVLEVLRVGLAAYFGNVHTYTTLYGAFAALPIFLLWMYLSWLVILLGAIITASLPLIRMGRWEVHRMAGSQFMDAIELLKVLVRERGLVPPGVRIKDLCAELRLNYDEIQEVLEVLLSLGYVAKVGGGFRERWVLVCDPNTATIGPVVDTLLIHREHRSVLESPTLVEAVGRVWLNRNDMSLLEALNIPGAESVTPPIKEPSAGKK